MSCQTVLRIWDCLFYEGSKILFRVALTLISHHQKLILQAQNFSDLCQYFKKITHGEFVVNCHGFMQVTSSHSKTILKVIKHCYLLLGYLFNKQSLNHSIHLELCMYVIFSLQNIFKEPGSLSMTTINKLRETCRERIQAQEL